MANLKRNMIKLVKNPQEAMKGAEIEYETFWTSPFIPAEVTYEALDLADMIESGSEKKNLKEREAAELLEKFVCDKLYGGQFTSEDIKKRYHGPDLIGEMQSQVIFIAQGQQSDDTKKFLAKKR